MGNVCSTDEKSTHKKTSSDLQMIEQFPTNVPPLVNVVIQYKPYIYFNYCYLSTKTIEEVINDFSLRVKDNPIYQKISGTRLLFVNSKKVQFNKKKTLYEVLLEEQKEIILPEKQEQKEIIQSEQQEQKEENGLKVSTFENFPKLYMYIVFFGLKNLSENSKQFFLTNTTLVAKPLPNPFRLFIFFLNDYRYQRIKYKNDCKEVINSEISCFNAESSYCNACDLLYISMGKKDDKSIGYLWVIDIKKSLIELLHTNLKPRQYHSMIFIPNQYVFIIGGINNNTVIYYDTQEKTICTYLPIESDVDLYEPALSYINDRFIYVIENKEKINIFKTDLRIGSEWMKITPNINDNNLICKQKLFGVAVSDKSNIIFIGGHMSTSENQEVNIIEFDTFNNTFIETTNAFFVYDFQEKTFLHLNTNEMFQIYLESFKPPVRITYNINTHVITYSIIEKKESGSKLCNTIHYEQSKELSATGGTIGPNMVSLNFNYNVSLNKVSFTDIIKPDKSVVGSSSNNSIVNQNQLGMKNTGFIKEQSVSKEGTLDPIKSIASKKCIVISNLNEGNTNEIHQNEQPANLDNIIRDNGSRNLSVVLSDSDA